MKKQSHMTMSLHGEIIEVGSETQKVRVRYKVALKVNSVIIIYNALVLCKSIIHKAAHLQVLKFQLFQIISTYSGQKQTV